MRIHRISLRHFRGVQSVDVAFDAGGVTIVEGRNEVGKTSLADAFMLLLDAKDTSATQTIRDIQPIGEDVAPFVEAELTLGPHRLTYRKQWLKEKRTELEVTGPEPAQLIGEAAHSRVIALLDAHTDQTLFKALRYQQGVAITQSNLGNASSLATALDAAAGGASSDIAGQDALLERVEAERRRYFTEKGAVLGARRERSAQLDGLREQAEESRQRIRKLDTAAERQLQIEQELVALAGSVPGIEQQIAQATGAVHAVEDVERHLERADHAAQAAENALGAAIATQEIRHALVQNAAASQQALDKLQSDIAAGAPGLQAAEETLSDAISNRGAAAESLQEAERDAAQHRSVAQLFETKLERDQFRERLDRVQKADEIIAAAESFLAGCNLDDSKLAEIDAAANSLAVAEGRAAAGRPQLALEALAPIDVVIDGTSHEVRPGTPLGVAVAGRLEAVIADVARITISGPDADADADAALTDSQRDLDGLLRAAGVSSPAEARQLARARSAQLQELNNARQRRAADLSDLDPPQLAAKLGRAQERLDALDAGIDPTAPGVATIDDARSLAAAAHSRVEQARALHDRRRTEVEAAEGALRLLQDKRIEDRTRLQAASEDARRYADELQVQRRDAADDAVNEAVEQAQATLQAAQQEHRGAAQKLAAADPATARAALENAQALQKRLDHDIRALELERATTGAQLEAEGHDGLAGRLADTQARLEDLRREIESEDRRAAAVAHLHAVLTAKRYAAKQAYIGPYSDKINAYARILYGSDVVVNVDTGTFEITSRTLNGRTEAFHRLSGGAREQLAVIARLACGALVSPSTGGDTDGGVPVLIDDALGYSDPDKLAKIGAAFTVAGRECQVIVLTCEPSRYRGVGAARVVSLG